jgi:type 1 glutamine amidotransferase
MWISTRGVVLLSATALVGAAGLIACSSDSEAKPKRHAQVLVFSKTAGPRTDEWYDFRSNPRGTVHVLATIDESTYSGGTMGADHPIAWCHSFKGGRAWYTAGGHTAESYSEADFRRHLLGGILWAAGLAKGNCRA